MAQVKVDFEVTPGSGATGYWIAVGSNDVPLDNGKGSIKLATGTKPYLIWWFTGGSGTTLAIEGKRGLKVLVKVKESKIPPGEYEGAGAKRFEIT